MFYTDVIRNRSAVIISWIKVVIWMVTIYFLSSQPASQSNELSRRVTEILVLMLGYMNILSIEVSTVSDSFAHLNSIIRSYAHGVEYLILALLVADAFRKSGRTGIKAFVSTALICSIYALTDEMHQILVPGRACEFTDYMVDFTGTILGYAVFSIFHGSKVFYYGQWGNKKS